MSEPRERPGRGSEIDSQAVGLGPWSGVRGARLAVLGSPIAHSKSPLLHAAAHEALGLVDRRYERVELREGELAGFLATRGEGWRGLSVTMPLKSEALAAVDEASELARLTGAVNTIVFETPEPGSRMLGDNTDVAGIVEGIRAAGLDAPERADLLGAGATAKSALAALRELGAREVRIVARSPERSAEALGLARLLGLEASFCSLDAWSAGGPGGAGEQPLDERAESAVPELVLSTLPVDAARDLEPDERIVDGSALFDVVYIPWPSPLAERWLAAGRPVVPGSEMLLFQAVEQARRFAGIPATTDAGEPWPERPRVEAAMRAALAAAEHRE